MISTAKNLCLGVVGTAAAWKFTVEDGAHIAAMFAGACTGVWMLTQTFLALRNRKSK